MSVKRVIGLGVVWATFACTGKITVPDAQQSTATEICDNSIDDNGNGVIDCVDAECADFAACMNQPEQCTDGLDNDGDGDVDCVDIDCAASPACTEICDNLADDNGDFLVDCDDPQCNGIHPSCGEICGDGVDNDGDSAIDCADSDCFDVVPPCGGGSGSGGVICTYNGSEPHPCECNDGEDNDGDNAIDGADLHCYGPFDDDEGSYATGIPGDNNGANAPTECPFDGNSGPGNDGICCNPEDPTTNVTPNGCDNVACCEVDLNGNGTGEHVSIYGECTYTPTCTPPATAGCGCTSVNDCDAGESCIQDDDSGSGFCSPCEPCTPNAACDNPCDCGETCFGGFTQPLDVCGATGSGCPGGEQECPNGDECAAGYSCSGGCCYPTCDAGITPCADSNDCETNYICITGCCRQDA